METLGGILLFIAAVLAILIANSPYHLAYKQLFAIKGSIGFGNFFINKPLLLWINDGLMALYFMLVGLEIKREIKRGILSNKTSILIPAVTAISGLVVPALLFSLFNYQNPIYLSGWAIPTATDIAFSLGILSLLGSRIPFSLKILLTAIAIFDDIGAIAIIAVFYTKHLSLFSLSFALLFTLILIGLNYVNSRRISLFMIVGAALWVAVLKSGVHATLAGIIIAMTIPDIGERSLLTRLESSLHPWAAFFILPVFAFANAGVSFIGLDGSMLTHPIVLGIALGLILGKQIGIFLPLSYFIKFRKFLATDKINLKQIYGLSLLCGVGFTMSLFIGSLAYSATMSSLMPLVKIGVVFGSFTAGILGYGVLRRSFRPKPNSNSKKDAIFN